MAAGTATREGVAELRFPADFWWGAATAAYQIEGALDEDGRTACIWDTFAATPGKTFNGDSGRNATEHYFRYQDDVGLMADLGLSAYRFSVAWTRVRPRGGDRSNSAGLAFYDRLVDELLDKGIRPAATLYHWDLPQELEDAGGWVNRDTAYRFADYSADVASLLADRVQLWCTLNEPWCSAFLGYGSGAHAPGRTNHRDALTAAHHLLLAHGLSSHAIRAVTPQAQISFAINAGVVRPVSEDPSDVDAARRIDGLLNRIFLDPVLRGSYPDDVMADTAEISDWSFVQDGDLETIHQPLDALGLNYYQPDLVGAAVPERVDPHGPYPTGEKVAWHRHPVPHTDMDWPIDPSGLEEILLRIKRDYGDLPLYITENGAAFPDRVVDGQINDADRIDFLHAHLAAAHQALAKGANLRGYFLWSLLDNFEWAQGYSKRFGIIHVDYKTQQRILKQSAHWYRDVIAAGGIPRR
ncbi:MAG TPA: beta-glucosidase [Micromonosporaceae bacterium]|nr:beta-glucosidase [Micromonosporaceae bacterium]HCU52457.1 beta-glucosidase [Micromonosporaceae bacterium]